MANTNTISGSLIDFFVRDQGTSQWKQIVCTEGSQFSIQTNISKKRTNCGIKGAVADPEFSASGNAIQNASPTTAEASYQYIKARLLSKAKQEFKYQNADTGSGIAAQAGIYNYGDGYFTEAVAQATAEADGFLSFSWKFEGVGTLDTNESP